MNNLRSYRAAVLATPVPRKLMFTQACPPAVPTGKIILLTDFLKWDQTIQDARKVLAAVHHG